MITTVFTWNTVACLRKAGSRLTANAGAAPQHAVEDSKDRLGELVIRRLTALQVLVRLCLVAETQRAVLAWEVLRQHRAGVVHLDQSCAALHLQVLNGERRRLGVRSVTRREHLGECQPACVWVVVQVTVWVAVTLSCVWVGRKCNSYGKRLLVRRMLLLAVGRQHELLVVHVVEVLSEEGLRGYDVGEHVEVWIEQHRAVLCINIHVL